MLYLVQHGHAKAEDEDAQRPLSAGGIDDVTQVAHFAVDRLGARPVRIIHSGKLRARQTAEIWGGLLDVDTEENEGLAPNDDPAIWIGRLATEPGDLMLVGHLPHLARLAGSLLTGDPDHFVIRFRQGGLVALEHTDTGWNAALLLPPSGVGQG